MPLPTHLLLALAPFLGAYATGGGKTPPALAVVAILACLAYASASRQNDRSFPASLLIPWIALFAWCLLPLLRASALDRHLFVLAKIVTMAVFGASMFHADRGTRRALGRVTLALGILESVLFWIFTKRVGWDSVVLSGNSVYAGLLIGGGLLFLASESEKAQTRREITLTVACAAVLSLGLFGLRSKSAMLGTAAGLLCLPCRRGAWRVGLTALAIGALSLLNVSAQNLAFSLQDLPGRLVIWKTALVATSHHAIIGVGLGNFEAAYLRYQLPEPSIIRFGKTSPFAHNDALQLAVTAGLPALALMAWALFEIFRRQPRGGDWDRTDRWALSVVALTLVTGLFTFSVYLPLNGLMFAGALGILSSRADWSPEERRIAARPQALAAGAVAAAVLAAFGVSWLVQRSGRPILAARIMPIRSAAWYEAALTAQRQHGGRAGMELALPYLEKSVFWNREDAFGWSRLARTIAVTRPDEPAAARTAFERARVLAPFHATFWVEEAFFELDRGSAESAARLFERAATLEPHTPLPYYGLAAARFKLGERSRAIDHGHMALKLISLAPNSAGASEYARFLFRVTREQVADLLRRIGTEGGKTPSHGGAPPVRI